MSPASSAGRDRHRAPWQPGPPLHPAGSGEKEELRFGFVRDMGLGGLGWAKGTSTRAGVHEEHEKHWPGLTAISWWPVQAAAASVDGTG